MKHSWVSCWALFAVRLEVVSLQQLVCGVAFDVVQPNVAGACDVFSARAVIGLGLVVVWVFGGREHS